MKGFLKWMLHMILFVDDIKFEKLGEDMKLQMLRHLSVWHKHKKASRKINFSAFSSFSLLYLFSYNLNMTDNINTLAEKYQQIRTTSGNEEEKYSVLKVGFLLENGVRFFGSLICMLPIGFG